MKRWCFLFLLLTFGVNAAAQLNVILDADIDSDVDDVAALAMIHHLAAGRQINLLGVIVTSDDPYAPVCVDVINRYFTGNRIPIGFDQRQPTLKNHSRYTKQLGETFPHPLRTYKDAADAVTLYRKLLSKSADQSVTVVTIGHLSSLSKLLQSGPDRYAADGKALALKKISRWICMGGQFPAGKEANFYRPDPASTVYCLQQWTNLVVFCGWELGKEIISGGPDLKDMLPKSNPVYRAFELYNQFAGRPSWDQVAVLLLDKRFDHFFESAGDGRVEVSADGSNRWIPGASSNHSYLRLRQGVDPHVISALIHSMLVKQQ